MKPSSILTAAMAALAAPVATAPTDNTSPPRDAALLNSTLAGGNEKMVWCDLYSPLFIRYFTVVIRGVPQKETWTLCSMLWTELKGFEHKCAVSKPHCEYTEVNPGEPALEWKFSTSLACNGGCIAAAYYGATQNKYGAMDWSRCP